MVWTFTEPPLGSPDQVGDTLGTGSRSLRAARGAAEDEQPLRLSPRLEPGNGHLRRRVADVDARDEHER